jgi:signal transduction histidine kinase
MTWPALSATGAELAPLATPRASMTGVTTVLVVDDEPIVREVERVLSNLLTNALRHTPSDGAIAVVVEPLEQEVRVSVEDTGEGLPADSIRRVFDRFWRGDPARARATGGGGLGLAIARGLVEAQGGRIWAENSPHGGARISFTLQRVVTLG